MLIHKEMDKQTKNGTRKTAYLLVKIVIFRDAAKNTDDYCDTELSSVARIKKLADLCFCGSLQSDLSVITLSNHVSIGSNSTTSTCCGL